MPILEEIEHALEYLQTSISVSEWGPIEVYRSSSNPRSVEDGYFVTVTAANGAPAVATGPRVVFIGLNFIVSGAPANSDRSRWLNTTELWRGGDEPEHRYGPETATYIKGGEPFPILTPAERDLGQHLFPGQSVSCMYTVPADALAGLEFHVEATVLRRHLFHALRTMRP